VGTVLVIALLIVPAAVGRTVSARLPVVALVGAVVGAAGGYLGLLTSYYASVDHGILLASGATVVLALVAIYLVALAVVALGRTTMRRRRSRAVTVSAAPAAHQEVRA
jgi:manganese/iron transport system permease protein